MSLAPGTLDKRVAIKQRSAGQDAAGQPVETWVDVISDTPDSRIWASIRHAAGLETIKAGADVSIVKASIRIRYRTGLNAGMRVEYAGVVYDIKAVLPDMARREYVALVCEVIQ